MSTLVVYASKNGATRGIAERIAQKLVESGEKAEAKPVELVDHVTGYDAFVIGSAVYAGHWQKKASDFVRLRQGALVDKPVWLFSSGPLGPKPTDPQGRDVAPAEPREVARWERAFGARDHRVFFGALDAAKLGPAGRALRKIPGGRKLLPEGDFRDWAAIDEWAAGIARELAAS